jgi:hypothetical protein
MPFKTSLAPAPDRVFETIGYFSAKPAEAHRTDGRDHLAALAGAFARVQGGWGPAL